MFSAPSQRVLLALLALGLQSCRKTSEVVEVAAKRQDPAWFSDVTAQRKLNFVHVAGGAADFFMPANVGSGLALLDFDNDGLLDIYLVQNGGKGSSATNALFHHEPDGTFRDVSAGSGLDVVGRGMGVAIGDVNNDGWSDVAVTEFATVRLFENRTDGTFREITSESGVDNPQWAISACFFDYDRDGWLDLVVANYVAYDPNRPCFDERGQPEFCGPKTFPPGTITRLFRNRGAETGARFADVTIPSGLGELTGPGLGVVCADFDGDRWPDVFVANDGAPNRLWINRRDGTFKDEAVARGVAFNGMGQAQGNMGIGIADVNGDGSFDLFVTHLIEETHTLWAQTVRGLFQDRTALSGMARPLWHGTGFGTVLEDFNNDGAPDAAIVNGGVRRNKLTVPDPQTVAAIGAFWAPYAERNQIFANHGKGKFSDISPANDAFCGSARLGRGLACGDLDADGGLDLIVSNVASPAHLYRNMAPQRGHWLIVRAVDPAAGGRDAYGAEITVRAAHQHWTRWCNPGSSYASSSDPRAHFGLGLTTRIDAVQVLWPDGRKERFREDGIDRVVVLRKGGGEEEPD